MYADQGNNLVHSSGRGKGMMEEIGIKRDFKTVTKVRPGTVYWITGLAGAGKTTIARGVYEKLRCQMEGIVLLDGDDLRKSVAQDLGYTREDRLEAAMRYARLSAMLASQGITVVIGTISMFHDVRRWNREHIENYCEIYLDVPMDVLQERNQKNLYGGAAKGSVTCVVGMDMEVEVPETPDIRIVNDGILSVEACVKQIEEWRKNESR